MSETERIDVLESEIRRYVNDGYRLTARTATTAQLIRPKTFSVATAALWTLFLLVGLLIYLLQYAARRDDAVYLSINEFGQIECINSAAQPDSLKPGQWQCARCDRPNRAEYFDCTACGARRP